MLEMTINDFTKSVNYDRNIRQKIDVLENALFNGVENEEEIINSINILKEMIGETKLRF